MTASAEFVVEEPGTAIEDRQSPPSLSRRSPTMPRAIKGVIGLRWVPYVFLAMIVVAAVLPGLLTTQSPVATNLGLTLHPPSLAVQADGFRHVLGTDEVGRDTYTRLVYGARPVIQVALASLLVGGVFGTTYGILAAFAPRSIGELMMRLADIQMSIPGFILAILLAFTFSPGVGSLILTVSVVTWPRYARVIRSETLRLRSADFIRYARAVGLGFWRTLTNHVVRNIATTLVVLMGFNAAAAVVIESSLSFLGYGIQPPDADWGAMIAKGVGYLDSWWLVVVPGVAITALILACDSAAEDLRRRFAPTTSPDATADSTVGSSARRRSPGHSSPSSGDGEVASSSNALCSLSDVTVSKRHGSARHIVQGVDLVAAPGEVITVVGESGSGKSTVCRALLGLLPRSLDLERGTVTVSGHDITAMSENELRAVRGRVIGAIFQDPATSLNPVRRVVPQIVETREIHRLSTGDESTHWARTVLAQLGFSDVERVLDSYPHELSGGMRQRVCIAIGIAGDPQVLVADEPTSALDVSVRDEVLDGILSYQARSGCAVVLVTHDIGVVRAVADRIIVMYGGRVLENGPADRVLVHPRSPYTKALLDASISLDPALRGQDLPTIGRADEIGASTAANDGGCPFVARCERSTPTCRTEFPTPIRFSPARSDEANRRPVRVAAHTAWCWNPVTYDHD